MGKVYIPIANIPVNCPKCGTLTHYRRDGYDGELGEGQYCDKCKEYVNQNTGFIEREEKTNG